jgi:surface protein
MSKRILSKKVLTFLLIALPSVLFAQGEFITRWNLAPSANALSFGTATSGTVNYTWQELSPGSASGSGSFSGTTANISGLPSGAIIRLEIKPTNFQRINIGNQPVGSRLLEVMQWGSTVWTSMQNAFFGCSNLNVTATDIPVLTSCTRMDQMFQSCSSLTGPANINSWNTGAVTVMSSMFNGASSYNRSLGNWNLSAVVGMVNMLNGSGMDCSNYSATLIGWNANPNTPNGIPLGAAGKTYDPTATAARANLVLATGSGGKGWTITGDAFSSSCNALPVTWLDFTGQFAKNNVILNWKTASEQNNTGFDVERSSDGRSWSKIGFIPGKTNSAVPTPYSYTDLSPLKGLSYYRLKQIDLDNKFSYSRTVQINGLTTDEASVWPNPVKNMLNIGINERYRNEKVYLTVTDMKGTVLVSRTVTNGNSAISTAAWSKALYVVTLRSGRDIIMTKKIVKQ